MVETAGDEKGCAPVRGPLDLPSWVYANVKQMILAGEMPPGAKIKQEHLAERLGISRTPLVLALQRLASENLITYNPRRGFEVRVYTPDEIAQLELLREACEGVAAFEACTRATDDQIRGLRRLMEPFRAVREWTPELVRRYTQADIQFHHGVVELSANPFILQTFDTLCFLHITYQMGLLRPVTESLAEHLEILEALEARLPRVAREKMERHIGLGRENVHRRFGEVHANVQKPGKRGK